MLILARESRGLTQGDVANKSGIRQSVISKYENGMLDISEECLTELSRTLNYPASLFTKAGSRLGFGSTFSFHRKRKSLPVRDLKRIQAKVNLKRFHIGSLLLSAEIEPKYEFQCFDIHDYEKPELIANNVRRAWNLPIGPIRNLVDVIERAGAIVVPFLFGTRKLDAIGQWPDGMPPLFFINVEMPWERVRFSLAHELGHLIMHHEQTKNQEAEADAFASAFLMPEREISSDLSNLTIPRAAQLKPYWRTSMQALIYRAHALKQISTSQYRRLFTQISRLGYRLREPNQLSWEDPKTLGSMVRVHLNELGYTIPALSALLDLYQDEFESSYWPRTVGPITIVK